MKHLTSRQLVIYCFLSAAVFFALFYYAFGSLATYEGFETYANNDQINGKSNAYGSWSAAASGNTVSTAAAYSGSLGLRRTDLNNTTFTLTSPITLTSASSTFSLRFDEQVDTINKIQISGVNVCINLNGFNTVVDLDAGCNGGGTSMGDENGGWNLIDFELSTSGIGARLNAGTWRYVTTPYTQLSSLLFSGAGDTDYDDFIVETGATDGIVFTNPTDSEVFDADFQFWEFDYTLAAPTSSFVIDYVVNIEYTASSTQITTIEENDIIEPAIGQESGSIVGLKGSLLSPDTYTTTATLYEIDTSGCSSPSSAYFCFASGQYTSSTLATSTISFSTEGYAGYFPPYVSTSTLDMTVGSCDTTSGFWANSLCNMMNFLFVPSQTIVNSFDGIGDLIKTKPPMGYFSEISDALNGFASSTLATPEFVFDEEIGGFNPIATMRTGFGWLFWFVFGVWVFHRLRNFNFHH